MKDEKQKPILVPEITPELLAENDDWQKIWSKKFVYSNPSIDGHTMRVIQSNLEILRKLIADRRKVSGTAKISLLARIHGLRDETAAWLSSAGDFGQAAEIAYTRSLKTLYKSYSQALAQKDANWCDCPRWTENESGISQNAYREFDFFSAFHGRRVSMIRCNSCGYRNARELDADLAKLSEHRAAARAVAGDADKKSAEVNLATTGLNTVSLRKILK